MESVDFVLYWSPPTRVLGFFPRNLSCLPSKDAITGAYYISGFEILFLSNEGSYDYFSLSFVVVGGSKDLLRDSLIVCFLCCIEVMCTGEYTVEDNI